MYEYDKLELIIDMIVMNTLIEHKDCWTEDMI